MKNLFIAEIEKISDANLKNAAYAAMNAAPEYFWSIAASTSGKYHPECDLGLGGLVRHSIMVSRIAVDLIDMESEDSNYKAHITDIARFAGLFHDVIKCGYEPKDGINWYTVWEHPILASEFLMPILKANNIADSDINLICGAIRTHMGRWTVSKYSNIKLTPPSSHFQMIIHTADYIASRKYIGGLEEWR